MTIFWDPDHLGNIVRDFNDADLVYTGVRVQTFTVAGEVMHERIHQLPFDFSRLLEGNLIFTVELPSLVRSGMKLAVTMSVCPSTRHWARASL